MSEGFPLEMGNQYSACSCGSPSHNLGRQKETETSFALVLQQCWLRHTQCRGFVVYRSAQRSCAAMNELMSATSGLEDPIGCAMKCRLCACHCSHQYFEILL